MDEIHFHPPFYSVSKNKNSQKQTTFYFMNLFCSLIIYFLEVEYKNQVGGIKMKKVTRKTLGVFLMILSIFVGWSILASAFLGIDNLLITKMDTIMAILETIGPFWSFLFLIVSSIAIVLSTITGFCLCIRNLDSCA